jgi:uncharacterized lipoprotein YajG
MTRKDYVAIAGAINEAIQDSQESTRVFKADNNNFDDAVSLVIKELVRVFKADNNNFDTDRFVDACLRTAA